MKRNQHFVPRCYLRAFSVDGRGKAINLYNIHKSRAIETASVRHQCSGRYFYGKDTNIEDALERYEILYSSVIQGLRPRSRLLTPHDVSVLRGFLALLYARTEAALRRTTSFFTGMDDTLRRLTHAKQSHIDLSRRLMLLRSLSDFSVVRENISDLRASLVVNDAPTDFVTSDDPVAFSSRFHAERLGTDNFGIGSPGVFFALPLSPRLLLLCYDRHVYIASDKKADCIVLTDDRDVYACNVLQYLGAWQNIYFSDWEQRHRTASELRSILAGRRTSQARFSTFVPRHESREGQRNRGTAVGSAKGPRKALIGVSGHHVLPQVWVSKLDFRKRVHYVDTRSALGYLRAEVLWNRYRHKEPAIDPDTVTRPSLRPPAVSVCAEIGFGEPSKSRTPQP